MTTEITTEHAVEILGVIENGDAILRSIKAMADQWAVVERPPRPMVPTGTVPRPGEMQAPREHWQSELDKAATCVRLAQQLLRDKMPEHMACHIDQHDRDAAEILQKMHDVANRWQASYTVEVVMPNNPAQDIVMTLKRIGGTKNVA